MRWINFFHIYQPPRWPRSIIRRVARESYRPLVRFLMARPTIHLTLNVNGSLTEQLRSNGYRDVIAGIRKLLERGQIELTDSSMYHAILPLLPNKEVRRQILLNRQTNRRAFGPAYQPGGFFLPEMAYAAKLDEILDQLGYRWIILDGISHPGVVDYLVRNQIRGTQLTAIFRNRYVSDYLAFAAQLNESKRFLKTVRRWNGQTDVLVTAMDGENLGHHRRAARGIWQKLVRLPYIRTLTVSELLPTLAPNTRISPRAASWSSHKGDLKRSIPFRLWKNPKNGLHKLQWRLFSLVTALIRRREQRGRIPTAVRHEFDQAVASDWYWWASREPWWDVDIIVTAAHRLQTIADEISISGKNYEVIHRTVEQIVALAQRWHSSGEARRHAARFLRAEQTPRYLGGERVR